MSIDAKIVADLVKNDVKLVTTVPCKQLAGVIAEIDRCADIHHIPANKEDEGIGICAGAFMGGKRSAIIMQNTALGVTVCTRQSRRKKVLPCVPRKRRQRASHVSDSFIFTIGSPV